VRDLELGTEDCDAVFGVVFAKPARTTQPDVKKLDLEYKTLS